VSAQTFTITRQQLTALVGDDCLSPSGDSPVEPLQVAMSAMQQAADDLGVLCHATSVEGVDPDKLTMVLLRVAYRLEAASSLAWDMSKQAEQTNGAENANGGAES
jgi:hypothetical protein